MQQQRRRRAATEDHCFEHQRWSFLGGWRHTNGLWRSDDDPPPFTYADVSGLSAAALRAGAAAAAPGHGAGFDNDKEDEEEGGCSGDSGDHHGGGEGGGGATSRLRWSGGWEVSVTDKTDQEGWVYATHWSKLAFVSPAALPPGFLAAAAASKAAAASASASTPGGGGSAWVSWGGLGGGLGDSGGGSTEREGGRAVARATDRCRRRRWVPRNQSTGAAGAGSITSVGVEGMNEEEVRRSVRSRNPFLLLPHTYVGLQRLRVRSLGQHAIAFV